jgi:threonylcarbamoyladenosine tRNA methylthiotransferase MtaB
VKDKKGKNRKDNTMEKIAFMTLGCKVNQADTASMQELFRQAGYTVCNFTEEADVYVVNTCVVTNTGQQKSRQMIRRAIRKENDALIVVTGCYPQTAAEEVKAIDGVDLIIGTQDRAKIVTLVEAALEKKRNQIDDEVRPWEQGVQFEEMSGGNEADKTRAYLKIQEGCNQYCSYCIIPYARGPIRSRSLQSIRKEVQCLTEAGYREIVLIGIHLGCYGKEMKDGTTLYDAVQAALSVPTLQRLRLGSLESVEVEERLLDLMGTDKRLCPHLHLPLQSGCDKILKDMHRPYDTKRFATLLEQIRKKVPGIAVTTDVIVGFPGETEADFDVTCNFVKQCGFAKMHIFPYSKRKGTPAAARQDQIPENVKKQRAEKLAEIDRGMQQAHFAQNVGTNHAVLVEQPVITEKKAKGFVEGLTENYIRVELPGSAEICGKVVEIKITEALIDKCRGIIL